jgi:hypothetical protein
LSVNLKVFWWRYFAGSGGRVLSPLAIRYLMKDERIKEDDSVTKHA